MSQVMLAPGTRLDAFEILQPIGAGGMGEVYRASDARIDRLVAIKILPTEALGNPAAEARFEREARALAALNHPRICTLFEFSRHDGNALLIMEYVQGQPLNARLAAGRVPLKEALRIGAEIADGLAAAHGDGLIHRDLKPGNVMLTRSGRIPKPAGRAPPICATSSSGSPAQSTVPLRPLRRYAPSSGATA